MALGSTIPIYAPGVIVPTGIPLTIIPFDTSADIELQRAPQAAGIPDVANAVTIAHLAPAPASGVSYIDYLPLDNVVRYYRLRHVSLGLDPSAYSDWTAALVPLQLDLGRPEFLLGGVSVLPGTSVLPGPPVLPGLPTLPNAAYPPGAVLVKSTDGVTYQNVADVWVSVSPPPPTGAEFIKIVAALPTLPNASYPIDTVVLLQSDSKLYRNQANVWTSYVDGNDLTANSVTTNKILAGAVTAAKIAVTQLSAIAADLGTVTIGLYKGSLDIQGTTSQPAGTFYELLRNANVAHGMTGIAETDVFGGFRIINTLTGGLDLSGYSEDDGGLVLTGIPTTPATGDNPSPASAAVRIRFYKKSGTGSQQLAASDNGLVIGGDAGGLAAVVKGDGRFLFADGAVSTPELAFFGDPDTGLYRIGANNVGIAVGGAKIADLASTLVLLGTSLDVQGVGRSYAGGSTTLARQAQVLFKNQALSHANVTESSVTSFSLPAATLNTDGCVIRITVTGEVTGSNSGFPRLKFGATNLDANAAILTTHKFVLTAHVVRTGAATQRAMLEWDDNGTITLTKTTPAETLSGAVTIDLRSSENAGGTTVFDSITIELIAA